jgi:flavin-dependent dehydrogenase
VIGAEHNGLVTPCYLACAGRRVLVLERRDVVGGACVSKGVHRLQGLHPACVTEVRPSRPVTPTTAKRVA